ncbi:MAG TPA: DIP1984 family protein [Acidimicrobiales bacterium]|nr:DIP1984 family protein [Acidimicrobiales bacterium]
MKLAEALSLRSDAQKRLAQLVARAAASARYQEGEHPAEDANALLAQARVLVDEAEDLVRRVNRTNAATELEPGFTITDAIARRDALAQRRRLVTAVADAAAGQHEPGTAMWAARQLRSELRQVTDVPVADLRREADDLARQHRELDVRIQEANWAVELAE